MRNLREGLGDSVRKESSHNRRGEYTGSRAYHRYFEGYEEHTVMKRNGRGTRIERLYRADYYYQDISDHAWIAHKILYAFLYVLAAALFIGSAAPSDVINKTRYMTFIQAISVMLYIWLFCVLCSYIISDRYMTISKYKRAFRPFKRAVMLTAAAMAAAFAAGIVFVVRHPDDLKTNLIRVFSYALSGVLLGIMYHMEKKISYAATPKAGVKTGNENEKAADA